MTRSQHRTWRVLLPLSIAVTLLPAVGLAAVVHGDLKKWHTVTIDFQGPSHNEWDTAPNPFLDYRLQVTFTAPSGRQYRVPGFFDGNGSGGGSGSVWRVRFTPDEAGTWQYVASFRSGTNVAVSLSATAGSAVSFNGESGSFTVSGGDANAPGFFRFGRLESVGGFYFKFRDGGYWVKSGIDNPENLLGYAGFDNTFFGSHTFAAHVADWNTGDPDWDSPDAPGTTNGRGIIGALNYLADRGINSIYFMPLTIGTDASDTWPYSDPGILGGGSPSNDNLHFDISKLAQWATVLTHAQRKGLFLHFVLGDKAVANKQELDNATLGTERKLFYRELIARFGHHNALQWNICEEYNLDLPLDPNVIKEFAQYINDVDPYDHPVTVHPYGNTYVTALAPFIGDSRFGVLSVQTWQKPDQVGSAIEHFRNETAAAGMPIPVNVDESTGMDQISAEHYRKRIIWDALLSGGGFELFSLVDTDLDDFSIFEEYMSYARVARTFVEDHLPFWEMAPADGLVTGENGLAGGAEVFFKPQEIYAIYIPDPRTAPTLALNAQGGLFEQRWFNPRTGDFAGAPMTFAGTQAVNLGLPPSEPQEDWVVLIRSAATNLPPVTNDQSLAVEAETPVQVQLDYTDPDGPGPYTFTVVTQPLHGTLVPGALNGAFVYTPAAGFTGIDSFTWKVHDGLVDSATATVQIVVGSGLVLLQDTFDRPDAAIVANGWVELETNAGDIEIVGGGLQFSVTADRVARPMIRRAFTATSGGALEWAFTFDWQRTGSEGAYRLFMQLGDSALLQDNAVDQGVGVNLVWTAIGGLHEQLGSRRDGTDTPLGTVSGLARITVTVDLDARTYAVSVNDVVVGQGLPFEDTVGTLDTIRLFTDGLNQQNFSGRRFDDLLIQQLAPGANRPPAAQGQTVDVAMNTPASIQLQASDPDLDPLVYLIVSPPAQGSLQSADGDATVVYVPNTGFIGPDSFSFKVHDGTEDSNIAVVDLLVSGMNAAPTVENQSINTAMGTAVQVQLAYTDPDGPGPYTFTAVSQPAHGALTPGALNGAFVYTPETGFTGTDSFTWTVHDGLVDSATATVQIVVVSGGVLLHDAFDRPDAAIVANGWVELETNAGDIEIVEGGLQFSVTADRVARPMIRRTFTATSAGALEWEFTFDWQRTGPEGSYRLFMQLGDSALLQDNAVDQGVGVNLVWTAIGGLHEQLGSRRDGTDTPLGTVSGLARITVAVDLDARTYAVSVNDVVVGQGLPFEDTVGTLDTVRLFTDGLHQQNFSGQRFDDLLIQQLAPGANRPPTVQGQNITTAIDTAVSVALAYTDADGPGPYTFTVVTQPLHGALTPGALNGTYVYTPGAGFTGSDSFIWQVHDGLVDSATATVQILVGSNPVLLLDDFDRPDAASVGNGWIELETNAGDVGVVSGALRFSVTADRVARPMIRRTFTGTSAGALEWEFTFDWQRTGPEGSYRVFMQLGDSTLLQDNAIDQGVGVNLVWTADGGVHQQLGSRRDGTNTPLVVVSGLARIKVSIDLDARTYTVVVNDVLVAQGLPFEDPVGTLDTVRFFTDGVNEQNFAGRRFDAVSVVRNP